MDSKRTEVYRDLWFDDGNLVIQPGLALFRVHKGVLCFHSSLLRDMASFPASASFDTYEGAQLAAFPDDAQDMHHFLRALYVPDYFLPPPEMETFEILEGVLRLAHKYDVPSLRRRALRHMARACITDLDELKDEINLNRSHKATFDDLGPLLEAEIALVREVQALWVLPILLLNMGLRDRHELTKTSKYAGKPRALSLEDLLASLSVYEAVMDSDMLEISYGEPCGSDRCSRREYLIAAVGIATARAKPLTAFDECQDAPRRRQCDVPRSGARRIIRKKRIWDSLPEFSGLPPWDELSELKKQDIEVIPLPYAAQDDAGLRK
ncbi:hypothetical protein FB107DRAFT_220568 [Schizophyllum commune]